MVHVDLNGLWGVLRNIDFSTLSYLLYIFGTLFHMRCIESCFLLFNYGYIVSHCIAWMSLSLVISLFNQYLINLCQVVPKWFHYKKCDQVLASFNPLFEHVGRKHS